KDPEGPENIRQPENIRYPHRHSIWGLKKKNQTKNIFDAGILESITLKNFMCHSLLGPFAFGSNVNFVVGNNGSGKSAILTALIVALGGNAHATNRGSSLKDFVKEGESSADVSITLRNKGKDAFKLEVYGPLITVEMRITRDGLRTYKLRSKDGQIISTKKEELISILDNFNIQVNNPVSVLTQEMSKHFLHSKGEGDKYKFFMKATQLEQMRETFVYIKATKQATQHKIEQQNEVRKPSKGFLYKSIEASSRNLRILESSRSNRLRRFGEHMPNLLDAIEVAHRRGQFKHKPRGPLGYLISLKDSELALAVEICLKNQLHAFTCDNYEDEKLLQDLMKKCYPSGRRPSIITSPFFPKVHDTRRRAVNHPEFPSVLQALEIEDPVVANCLIDQRGIESILLIKNNTQARKVMLGKNPPRNCTQAFSKEGDQIYTNRVYSADQTRANCLSGDVEEEISLLCNCRYILIVKRTFSSLSAFVSAAGRMRQNMFVFVFQDKMTKLQLELTDLQNIEEPQSEDLKALVGAPRHISSKQAEYDEAKDQMSKLKENYEEAEQEYKQHKESINTLIEEADSVKVVLYTKAAQICPERLDACRPAKSLDSEINRMKVKIATQQEQQGDRSEIVRYLAHKESYKSMSQQIRNLNSFIYSLTSVMNKRLQAYTEFRKFFSARCKYYFNSMLAQRGYSGSMIFDHKNETLSITVQPGQGNTADLSDMRSLSGGERSFSTVCFVLSLWAITEAPFRCLDEFDVYMDMVNRRISMDMMLKVASGQRFRQFIFLTPQNMSSLPICSNIRILRLKDPDRGQNNSSK
uniref:Structural maintenance of chromosomes protein 6 n=1 Tax=Oryzias sinensis TaxID=183150 RepID=A0A8C7XFD9_9TELE